MKAIQANPKNIKEIFSNSYIIPEFQRPYSWGKEECSKLVEDITDFFLNRSKNERYYLGNIVLYPDADGVLNIIDGQQRLTTILLLMNALFKKALTATILEECLKQKDPLTGKTNKSLRITTYVSDDDNKKSY